MKKHQYIAMASIVCLAIGTSCDNADKIEYPVSKKVDSVHTYFGQQVEDPYGWLEDDYSEETMAWVDAQNKVTQDYLGQLPSLGHLKQEMGKIWRYESYGLPSVKDGNVYYTYTDGDMNQPVLKKKTEDGSSEVILDPNTLSEDGTAAVSNYSFSHDNKYLGFSIAESGSDWNTLKVMDLATGEILDDKVEWAKFTGISWGVDGFYYSAYDAPKKGEEYSAANEYHQVFFHKIGTPQSDDVLIWRDDEHPNRNHYAATSKDGEWIILFASEGTSGNNVRISNDGTTWTRLVTNFEDDYSFLGKRGDWLYFTTNNKAPNQRVVAWNTQDFSQKEVLAEKEFVLKSAALSKNKMVLVYLEDVISHVYTCDIADNSQAEEVKLPGIGTVNGVKTSSSSDEVYLYFENFYTPKEVFYFLAGSDKEVSSVFETNPTVNSADYETIAMKYPSKDGTMIPLFITRKKGTPQDASTPCFLYGYGGFNISIAPHFKSDRIPFLNDGGIYVVANIRGGSEYGEEWHQQGIKMNKQNVFDDFIAAAEYLQNEGWTSKEKLAIHGRSNGGLLAGALLTQRQDLFQVAIPKVGVLDMLRYHKFTIGWAWASDYGRSDDSEEMFNYLRGYSPLHNVIPTEYPATLLVTGDHDDRVVPAHTFKFAAELQSKQQGSNPILLRVDKNAGHGAGKPVSKQIDEFADQWAFVYHHLGMDE